MNPSVYVHAPNSQYAVAAVQNTHSVPPLQRLVRRIVVHIASETEEIRRIKDAFAELDTSRKGKLSIDDLRAALKSAGYTLAEADLEQTFRFFLCTSCMPRLTSSWTQLRLSPDACRALVYPSTCTPQHGICRLHDCQCLFCICRYLDSMDEGFVNYFEFVAAALNRNMLVNDGQLRYLFNLIDDDKSETITVDNLMVCSHLFLQNNCERTEASRTTPSA